MVSTLNCSEPGCIADPVCTVHWPTHPDKPLHFCLPHAERAERIARGLGLGITKVQIAPKIATEAKLLPGEPLQSRIAAALTQAEQVLGAISGGPVPVVRVVRLGDPETALAQLAAALEHMAGLHCPYCDQAPCCCEATPPPWHVGQDGTLHWLASSDAPCEKVPLDCPANLAAIALAVNHWFGFASDESLPRDHEKSAKV